MEPWTRTLLASDFTHALATFSTITGFSYTPPANSRFTLDAELLVWTAAIANLPRIGVSIAGSLTGGYGAVAIRGPSAGATGTAPNSADGGYNNNAAVVNVQQAAGGLGTASVPHVVTVTVKGRSGAAPGVISLQMACETAGANICFVKAGSELRTRAS